MIRTNKGMPSHLSEPSKIRKEISVTGKWVPKEKGTIFKKTTDSKEMLKEWENIHNIALNQPGILSTEINHAVGEDAVLIHHVFENSSALDNYFSSTVEQHMNALTTVAMPKLHMVRGINIPNTTRETLMKKTVPGAFGEYLYGYVKNAYQRPEPETAIMVTAKWTCHESDDGNLEELKYWWQRVGTDAFSIEKGLLRFEVYQVIGEDALIIHETFENSNELQYHLSKGTAEKYKKDIDKIAYPEEYFFRGPVSWAIRAYSKFLHLPATYSSQVSNYSGVGGSMSDGLNE